MVGTAEEEALEKEEHVILQPCKEKTAQQAPPDEQEENLSTQQQLEPEAGKLNPTLTQMVPNQDATGNSPFY